MTTETFTDEPGTYDWVVPAGVTSLGVSAWGAGCYGFDTSAAVTPGETLTIVLGGAPVGGTGGYNGGGDGVTSTTGPSTISTAGCGATEVRRGDDPLFVCGGQGGLSVRVAGDSAALRTFPTLLWGGDTLTDPPDSDEVPRLANLTHADAGLWPTEYLDLSSLAAGGTHDGADGETITSYDTSYDTPPDYTFHVGAGGGGFGGGGQGVATVHRYFPFPYPDPTPAFYEFIVNPGRPGGTWFSEGGAARELPSRDPEPPQGIPGDGTPWDGAVVLTWEPGAVTSGWTVGTIGF